MDLVSDALRTAGADTYVMYASSRDADMRYMTRFTTSDPFVYLKTGSGKGIIIVSQMEVLRAARESPASVMTRSEAGLPDILKKEPDLLKATARMIAGQAGRTILVPAHFPVALAKALESHCTVLVDSGTVPGMRARKNRAEIQTMKRVQEVTQTAMERAVSLISKSISRKGILHFRGKPLTSEFIRYTMNCVLLEHGCSAVDTIVSCGPDTAIPHSTGSGPLSADVPIIIDLFPVDETSGYYADMTRTVVKGEPTMEIRDMYETLRDAKSLAVSHVRAGVSGPLLYQEVVDYFQDHGYESNTRGFVHNLGHGVGLQIHELPTVGPAGTTLDAGNVITIEPGLYYPGTGGVRIEDIGAVTAKGFTNFTRFSEELVV